MKHTVETEQKMEQSQIRIRNKAMILNAFRKHSTLQKQDLVNKTGLSITTVTTNINELLEEGLLDKQGIAVSTGGRKPLILELNSKAKYSVGVDIAPHKVSIIISNLMSETLFSIQMEELDGLTFEAILDQIIEHIDDGIKQLDFVKKNCLGVGLSLPGIVDEESLQLVYAPNLSVDTYSFQSFEERLGMRLFLENEANVAAFAEMHLGKGKSSQHLVFVSITDGLGCGLVMEGNVFKSLSKRAGEFGHMKISEEAIQCSCGRQGCWEMFASERALLRYYKKYSGQTATLKDLFEHFDDEAAQDALKDFFKYLSMGIENILLALDPEKIIIGGEIVPYLKSKDIDFNTYLSLKSSLVDGEVNRVVLSDLTPFSSVIGASLLPMIDLFGL